MYSRMSIGSSEVRKRSEAANPRARSGVPYSMDSLVTYAAPREKESTSSAWKCPDSDAAQSSWRWSSRKCERCCSPYKERRELLIALSVRGIHVVSETHRTTPGHSTRFLEHAARRAQSGSSLRVSPPELGVQESVHDHLTTQTGCKMTKVVIVRSPT